MPIFYIKAHTVPYSLQVFPDVWSWVSISTASYRTVPLPESTPVLHLLDEDSSPDPQRPLAIFYSCCTSAFLECHRNKIIHSLGSLFRLALPLSDMHLERYHVFMCNVITQLCYSRVLVHRECTRTWSPTHLLKDRWAGFLHSFAIMNKAARNICMFLCFQAMCMNIQACNWCASWHLCVQL